MPRNCTASRSRRSGPPSGLGVGASHLGHGPEPVQDPPGEADLLRELLVDVNRVEVARGAGVADRQIPVGGDLELELVAGLHDSPLTMLVQVPVQTASPRWFADAVSNT